MSFKKMFDDRAGSRMAFPTFIKQIRHNPRSTVRWGLISTALLSMLLLVSYMIRLNHVPKASPFDLIGSERWPNCPVPTNAQDVCIHTEVNITNLVNVCGTVDAAVGHCQDRFYGLIVTPGQHLETISEHTYKMVLEGNDIGTEMDTFVQQKSHWMIDTMGAKGYERMATYDDKDRRDLQKDLDQLQNRCDRFFFGGDNPSGFGSRWHNLGLALAHGLHFNMTLLTPHQPTNFVNMTTCTTAQMEKAFAEHPPETSYLAWNSSSINYKALWNGVDVWDLIINRTLIETRYEPKGHFWWRSMLTYYVTRPNAHMRQVVRDAPRFPTPCIGIHVRHSDKVLEANIVDLAVYMKKAKKFKSKTGISNVYLMTDDDAVIQATKDYPDFQFHYRDVPRTNKGWADDLKAGITAEEQEINFLLDIYTVVQCQKLIVTYSSNVGRLIGEFSHAIHNKEPDLDSVDGPWEMNP